MTKEWQLLESAKVQNINYYIFLLHVLIYETKFIYKIGVMIISHLLVYEMYIFQVEKEKYEK